MNKLFITYAIFSFLIITFSSCSRFLRPVAGNGNGRNPRTAKNGNANNNPVAKNPVYNISNFTGTINKNIVYGSNTNNVGAQQQLSLDVYEPPNAAGKKFPLILLIHGGTFLGGDKANLSSTCAKLANNGYVTVSINYRLGWGSGQNRKACTTDTLLLKQAIYRSVQDAHAAMRFLAAHANEYNIDKDWMFIGGQSAGAITALFTAYLLNDDSQQFFPGLNKELGKLDNASNNISTNYKLKGVISMWGAFVNPDLITKATALPTIFFQGEKDQAVPFRAGNFATPCPTSTLVYGTYPLYNRLKDLGETTIAHVDPNGGHGVFEEDFRVQNILCFLNDVRQGIKKQVYLTGIQSSCNQ